ncbi:MAG: hypothetical protein QM586_12420, partial [Xenophilus sp.]
RVEIGKALEDELSKRHGRNQHSKEEVENFPPPTAGKTRDIAAKAAGFGNGKTYEQAGFVISLNLHRRHLTESQRAAVAAKLANLDHGQRADQSRAANLPVCNLRQICRKSPRPKPLNYSTFPSAACARQRRCCTKAMKSCSMPSNAATRLLAPQPKSPRFPRMSSARSSGRRAGFWGFWG